MCYNKIERVENMQFSKLDDLTIRYFDSDLVEEITDITPIGDPNIFKLIEFGTFLTLKLFYKENKYELLILQNNKGRDPVEACV